MCRGKRTCTELGDDIEKWDGFAPLPAPQWFNDSCSLFTRAVELASVGNITESVLTLSSIRNEELQNWFIEHGQVSGTFRKKIIKVTSVKTHTHLDTVRSPDKYRFEVFERDNYICQYCGTRVIPKELLHLFSKIVGTSIFCDTGTNLERHGVVLAFRANADHIIPWTHGGRTHPDNLVTCCWSCNYGKGGYTLEELGLSDPRFRILRNNNWKGLTEYIPALKIQTINLG